MKFTLLYYFIYIFYLISLYVTSRLGIIITIQMKLLLETRSGHLPKNSRSLPDYEYKSHYVCMSKVPNKPTFTRVQND